MFNIADLANKAARLATNNSPAILTSIGVIGTITTAYLAAKATYKVAEEITTREADEQAILTPKERVKFVHESGLWKLYIPTVASGVASIVCIIGANRVGAHRAAGIAAAYTISERAFEEYRTKVTEKFGNRKEEQVRDDIVQDRIDNSYTKDVKLFGVSEGELCYDKFSGLYFLGSVEGINAAVNALNNAMNHEGYAALADLYRLLEMEVPSYSENIGWTHNRLVTPRISSALAHGSKPVIVLDFDHEPMPDYGRFH